MKRGLIVGGGNYRGGDSSTLFLHGKQCYCFLTGLGQIIMLNYDLVVMLKVQNQLFIDPSRFKNHQKSRSGGGKARILSTPVINFIQYWLFLKSWFLV